MNSVLLKKHVLDLPSRGEDSRFEFMAKVQIQICGSNLQMHDSVWSTGLLFCLPPEDGSPISHSEPNSHHPTTVGPKLSIQLSSTLYRRTLPHSAASKSTVFSTPLDILPLSLPASPVEGKVNVPTWFHIPLSQNTSRTHCVDYALLFSKFNFPSLLKLSLHYLIMF
jgi:hypothetical protein